MARVRKLVGIRRKRSGWQAFIWVDGKFYSKQFPIETPVAEMKAWREAQLEEHGHIPPPRGTFAADVDAYLARPEIAGRRYVQQLRLLLDRWLERLGRDRARASITQDEVEGAIQWWLKSGLAPATVYHRRTALLSLFMALDGPESVNPVRGTTRPKPWRPADRSVPFETLQRIVDAMPDGRSSRRPIAPRSLAKLRVRVLLHTGMPPGELCKLEAAHFNREEGAIRMPWRDKGQGRPGYKLPLSPEGLAAVTALDAVQGWGWFAVNALSCSFKRAARRVLGFSTPVRLYDLRHSYGTDLYRHLRDIATVGRLMGHVEGSAMTAQYARGAHEEVDRAALKALSEMRQAQLAAAPPRPIPAQKRRHSLPARLPKVRNFARR